MTPDIGGMAPVLALVALALAAVAYRAREPVIALLFVVVRLVLFWPLWPRSTCARASEGGGSRVRTHPERSEGDMP
jgi:hypothetical protein